MADQKNSDLKTLGELEGVFRVPLYQRGYRWGKAQIRTFLEDIETARKADRNQYFLQAIVVREINGDAAGTPEQKISQYELIDGQQRLTTTWLLSNIIGARYGDEFRAKFSISYASRKGSANFLQKAVLPNVALPQAGTNIDFWYIAQAVETIRDWSSGKMLANLGQYLLENVNILWHAHSDIEEDPETHFINLNSGRIPLQDAELCRAILLTGSNMDVSGLMPVNLINPGKADENTAGNVRGALIKNRQLLIGNAWDRIERELREQPLWGFLNGAPDQSIHIGYLLRIIYNKTEFDGQYPCYSAIEDLLSKNQKSDAISIWNDISFRFDRLASWFADNDYYHWLGYLSALEEPGGAASFWHDLLAKSASVCELCFKRYLHEEIRKKTAGSDSAQIELDDYTYANKTRTGNLLLLFNVEYARRARNLGVKFPFHAHNGEKWSLEHINAQKVELGNNESVWREWLELHKDALEHLDLAKTDKERAEARNELVKRCETLLNDKLNRIRFEELHRDIIDFFGTNVVRQDSVENLALLDVSKNAALNNALFSIKRDKLREWLIYGQDSENPANESFYVPLGTQSVFMRHFTDGNAAGELWTEEDMAGYRKALERMLSPYWPGLAHNYTGGKQ